MKAILACTPKGGIGYENKLPWSRLDGDLSRFKELTLDQFVIMGRNTWQSLPLRPLPNRHNVVVTSTPLVNYPSKDPAKQWQSAVLFNALHPNTLSVESPERFNNQDNAWIIGGAKLINSSWHLIDELHLSVTKDDYKCDTFIDLDYITANFKKIHSDDCRDHTYEIWKRK